MYLLTYREPSFKKMLKHLLNFLLMSCSRPLNAVSLVLKDYYVLNPAELGQDASDLAGLSPTRFVFVLELNAGRVSVWVFAA